MDPFTFSSHNHYSSGGLKLNGTMPAIPLAQIKARVGIGITAVPTAWAGEPMFITHTQCPTAMTTLAGVGCRTTFDGNARGFSFIAAERFQLPVRGKLRGLW